mmetsp:Transcript_42742/g.50083  ORF Transcript_42742/g.50083 Transcript_42742/m.50083 type:complete len:128 (-) Transcript_42742:804-1187(-)
MTSDAASSTLYSANGVCKDNVFDLSWSGYLQNNLNVQYITENLKSKLNADEKKELTFLLSQDYSELSKSLIANNMLKDYKMDKEAQFSIIKLLGLYRWSMLGKSDLVNPFTYPDSNFHHESSTIADP